MNQRKMSYEEADILLFFLHNLSAVTECKVYERTSDAVVYFFGERQEILDALNDFQYDKVEVLEDVIENSGRKLNAEYKEKLINRVVLRDRKSVV